MNGAVWRRVVLRRLFEERARTLLTLLGVALGVAVFLSVALAGRSAMRSFSDTVDAVAGRANLQVSASGEGIDERLYPAIRALSGVEAASPVVEAYVRARPGAVPADSPARAAMAAGAAEEWPETVMLLGLDLLGEAPFGRWRAPGDGGRDEALAMLGPRAIAITRTLAGRHGLAPGDTLTVLASGRPEPLIVRQVFDVPEMNHALGGNVVIADIAAAQEALGRYGRIDRVDLIVAPSRRDDVRARLAELLPADATVDLPRGRTRQVESMVRAFALNLRALSFIALFVATFLIFNAVAMSVLRWRREIGILRAVGMTRGAVAGLFLGEGLFFGVAGGALGLVLGTWLARGALALVSRTLTDLYLVRQAATLHADVGVYAAAFGLGVGAALVSALAPAIEASRTPPGVTMRQGMFVEAQRLPLGLWTAAGLAALAAAAVTAAWTVAAERPAGGFASAFFTLIGFALCAPAFTLGCERLFGRALARPGGIEGVLGVRYLRESVARTSAAVAALMVAVGMMVALTIMVGSFRRTVDTWVSQTIRGDLYVEPLGGRAAFSATALDDTLVARARALPGVVGVDTFRGTRFTHDGRIAFVAGVDFDVQRRLGNLKLTGGDTRAALAAAVAADGALVSESFARHHHVRRGDTLALATPSGTARLPVTGVYYDYTTDAGGVMMHFPLYERLWRTHRVQSLALYLAPGTDVDATRARLLAVAGELVLSATPNRSLRARVLTVFDQTFQITWALQAIAILVSVLGVIGTLTALILQRGREIAVLRAIGARRAQVRKMVLIESGLIGLIGALLGCACGVALAMLLIHVINRQYFGWTIQTHVGATVFVQAVVLMVASAIAAGFGPARLAATRVAAEAMRMD